MLLLLLFRAAFCHCWDKTTFLVSGNVTFPCCHHYQCKHRDTAMTILFLYLHFIWWVLQVVQEYERAVIFRLGRLLSGGSKGPGNNIKQRGSFKLMRIEYIPNHMMYCLLQLCKISCPINPNIDIVFCCCEYRLVIIMIGYPVWKQNSESAYCFSGLTTNLGDHF